MWRSLFTLTNPAPTLGGIVGMVVGVVLALFGNTAQDKAEGVAMVVVGFGVATARQNNKTSEDVGAK